MTIGGNTGQIQRLRNFSEIPLTFNHTLFKRVESNDESRALPRFLTL